MKIKIKNRIIYIEDLAVILIFVCIFSNKARIFLSNYFTCFLFVAFHEMAHILVASILNSEFIRLNIRISGLNAVLKGKLEGIKGIVIYLAGPIANMILALLFKDIKMIFEINLILALINLFPISPLDGYNVLKLTLNVFYNKKRNEIVIKYIQKTTEIVLFFIAFLILLKYNNFSGLLLLVYIKISVA